MAGLAGQMPLGVGILDVRVIGKLYDFPAAAFSVAIVTSFLCSLWEAVLLSITPSYAQIQLQKGTQLPGDACKHLKKISIGRLAAILTLNTIAHTVGAIGVGDQAAKIWADAHPLITGLAVPAVMTRRSWCCRS